MNLRKMRRKDRREADNKGEPFECTILSTSTKSLLRVPDNAERSQIRESWIWPEYVYESSAQ
jgi:hypothetical protein